MKPHRIVVLNVVGLTPRLLAHMPRLSAVAQDGFQAALTPVLPAVTCSAQATFLTGLPPSSHGIVGNGWYFRDLGEVMLWRQHNALVEGEKVWEAARGRTGDYRVANVCWWYAMGGTTDIAVTPRPVYHADGRKSPDCYTVPPRLRDDLTAELGVFPLFHYWGPRAGIASSQWIAKAAERILVHELPDLTLVYLPHLDYDLQRFGPESQQAIIAAQAVDEVVAPLVAVAREHEATVVVLSEYGITPASQPIHINRKLRSANFLNVYTQQGMEYLDPWTSQAFAVADHQIAHIYVKDSALVPEVRALVSELPGVDLVLDEEGKKAAGLDHEQSGELVAVARANAWFTYYYWLDDARAPDFARTVDIHRKPGYDPAELFIDPNDRRAKQRAALGLVRKKLGFRYSLNVVPLDPTCVRGTHGRLPNNPTEGPVLICSDAGRRRERISALEVKGFLLELAGFSQDLHQQVPPPARAT